MPDAQGAGGAGGGAKAKQSAVETLLGEHSALVNLDSLVQPRRGQQVTALQQQQTWSNIACMSAAAYLQFQTADL